MAGTEDREHDNSSSQGRRWQPSPWRWHPLSGLAALGVGIMAGLAAMLILITSNNVPVEDWQIYGHDVQPTVILAILSTLANMSLYYAFNVGITVNWWTAAYNGATLETLHRYWDFGQGSLAVLTAGKHIISWSAIANIFSILLLADGPLLQRASNVAVVTLQDTVNFTAPISPSPFQGGTTGLYTDNAVNPNLYTPVFASVLQQYNNRRPIEVPSLGCQDSCEFEIIGPGFDISCQNWTSPYKFKNDQQFAQALQNATSHSRGPIPGGFPPAYWSNITQGGDALDMWQKLETYRTGERPETWDSTWGNPILISTMIKTDFGLEGTFNWRYCKLVEAVQRYPVSSLNNTLTLRPMPWQQNLTEQLIYREPETGSQGDRPSTYGGLWKAVSQAYSGHARIRKVADWTAVDGQGSALEYIRSHNYSDLQTYKVAWNDPIDDAIGELQELTLRTVIASTTRPSPIWATQPGVNNKHEQLTLPQYDIVYPNLTDVNRTLTQRITAARTYPVTVYQSHYGWLVGALTIIALASAATMPLFWSYWTIGRPVSMSPLEIAKAFDAPLMRGSDPNASVSQLVLGSGSQHIRYGGFLDSGAYQGINTSVGTDKPLPLVTVEGVYRRRLGMSAKEVVQDPQKGEIFW